MTNEEIKMRLQQCDTQISKINTEKEELYTILKANYYIQPGDKVKVIKGNSKEEIGQCTALELSGTNPRPVIYPYKKDGEVSKNGRIYVWYGDKIEKL